VRKKMARGKKKPKPSKLDIKLKSKGLLIIRDLAQYLTPPRLLFTEKTVNNERLAK